MGVVFHGTHCKHPMLEKQAQADVLHLFKSLMLIFPIGSQMYRVHEQIDDLLRHDQLSVEQMENCGADKLASEALWDGELSQRFITSHYHFKNTRLLVKGDIVTGLQKNAITQHWGTRVAKTLFDQRNIARKVDFNLVYWEVMGKVMKSFPELFPVWVTKQVLHFNGTNRQLSWIDHTGTLKNICPSCGCRDKSPSHITHCWVPGQTLVFHKSLESIVQWMEDQQTGLNLVGRIRSYLISRGTKTAVSLLHPESSL
jgi:hypothetical protein